MPSHYKTDSTVDEPQDEELEPCVKHAVKAWEDWDQHWSSKMSEFEGYYDQWDGKPPVRNEEWQSQFHKRLTWQAEKTLVARFFSVLFPVSAPIDVDKTNVQNDLQGILAKSIVAHWFKIGTFGKEFLSSMRSAAIYGTGMFEDDWHTRFEAITDNAEVEIDDYRQLVDGGGQPILDEDGNVRVESIGKRRVKKERTTMQIVEDRYRVRKANIFSWRIHPSKVSDDDDYPVIKQEFITYDDLLDRQREAVKYGYDEFENMEKIKNDKFKINDTDRKRFQKDGDFEDKKNPQLEVLHYWGRYSDGEDEESKPMWIMVVNRKYKIKMVDNPYWHKKPPLFSIKWTEDEKESYYGIGIAKIGKSAEDRANNTINVRTDIKKKNVRGSGWYNALDKKIKKPQLAANTPGLMKPCSDVNNAVRYDVPPTLTIEDYKEEETATNDHREITGATTSMMPTADTSEQHDTLGGMQLLLSQSVQRLKPDLTMMEMQGIRKIANRAFLLTRQFMSLPETIEIIASDDQKKQFGLQKIYKLSPEQIIGKVKFHCTGMSESIEKAQNIDKLLKYAEVTGKIPGMQMVTNYQGIAKRIGLWLGFEDIQDFVLMNPNNPLAQMQPPQQPQPQGVPGAQPPPPQGAGGGLPPNAIAGIVQQMQASQQPRR